MAEFTRSELSDLADIERFAKETLRQCEFLRRNGPEDTSRFWLIANEAWYGWRAAARADRRMAEARGLSVWRWRMPRGYGVGG